MKQPRSNEQHFNNVLVPLDGSEFAAAALPTARAAAGRFGAQLSTISVAADDSEAESLRDSAKEALGTAADAAVVVVDPEPARVITQHADDLGGALIVMSSRGRGRVSGALLGSVARSVVASSTAPVLVVGPNADRPGKLVGRPRRRPDTWPAPLSVGSVVAAVDVTETSEAALPFAAAWAAVLGRDLVVLTIAEDAPPRPGGTVPNRFGPADPRRYVDGVAHALREQHPELSLVAGHVELDPIGAASGLTRYLDRHPTALVVLAAPGRTGMTRLRHGATAADMIRVSTAPTLVVPAGRRSSAAAGMLALVR